MELKGLMSGLGMELFAIAALVISFGAFAAVLAWAYSRPRRQVERWSQICLDEEDDTRNEM